MIKRVGKYVIAFGYKLPHRQHFRIGSWILRPLISIPGFNLSVIED